MPSLLNRRTTSIIFLFIAFLLFNAAADEGTTPAQRITAATHFLELAQYDSALVNFEKAERQFQINNDWKSLASTQTSIAEVYRVINNTEKSLEYLNSAYTICKDHLPGNTEELAKALEINGRVLDYNLREFEKAGNFYDSSLTIRKTLYGKEHLTISENIYLLGRTWFNRGQYKEAQQYFSDAVSMKVKLGGENEISLFDPYTSLGALNRRLLKMDQSLAWYKKAQAIWMNNKRSEDHPSIGMLEYGMGNLHIESGMYEDAKTSYRRAVKIFEEFFGEKDFRVATAYSNIGACYSNQLEYSNAVQYYTKAKTIYEKVLPESHPFVTAIYSDLGDMYDQFGKFEESLKYSGHAIALMEKYQDKKGNRELGFTSMYHASTLFDLGQFEEARKRIDIALSILETIDEQYLVSNAYTTSASIHQALKEYDKTDAHFRKAIELYPDSIGRTHHLGFTLGSYADFKSKKKDYTEALLLYDKSLYQLAIDVAVDGQLKQINDFQSVDILVSVLPGRGKTLLALYDSTKDQKFLHAALYNYTFLTDTYEKIIKENKSERSKLLQIPSLAAYYEKAVACALKLAEVTNDPSYEQQAFAFAEQGKAVILWQYIHDTEARQFGNIPLEITQEERRLKEKLSFHEKKMDDFDKTGGFEKKDSAGIALKEEHFRLRAKYDSLVNKLETDYPEYYNLKYKKAEPDLAALTKILKPEEAVLEYLTGEDNIYAFLITTAGLEVFEFKNDPDIAKITEGIRDGLLRKDMTIFSGNASAFYENFFQQIDSSLQQKKVTSVTIVPDGVISYIPMEALLRKNDSIPDYEHYSYLIHDYTFHYQYSAGLIPTYARIARENSSGDFIGFAPQFSGTQNGTEVDQLGALDFNREEVDNINAILKGKSLLGEAATEANFKKLVEDYSIVHLATHAVLDDQDADRSRLHFSSGDSVEDGRLHAYELFNMHIPASLVTLSACNTGAGKLHKGEGVMSLSRAFAYAGCPSIVTSLWQAQDRSTATLMKYFYEYLSEGKNKSEALSLAKIRYLRESDKVKSLPFFWAGFILVGDDAPLKKSRNTLWITVFFCASIPFIVIAIAKRKKRNSKVA